MRVDYLRPIAEAGIEIIVVFDGENPPTGADRRLRIYGWKERKKILGRDDDFFPRRNGACRSFGFLLAWRELGENELVIALDDDCEVGADFVEKLQRVFATTQRPQLRTPGVHLNALDAYTGIERPLFPRGFPYSARLNYTTASAVENVRVAPRFNLGLWHQAFDVNAIDKLDRVPWSYDPARLHFESAVIAPGTLISVCSMNMHFRREVIPAVFQFPMNVRITDSWTIDRYGDIWGGFVLKSLMDKAGDFMSVGEPLIRHHHEANISKNIKQEHFAHLVNDEFVATLSDSCAAISRGSYCDMMCHLTEEFERRTENLSPILNAYFRVLVPSLKAWTRALRQTN
ncbi:MAG: hypothetical protein HZA93_10600 [Verrucomicrobia bacterium]|nr:hypothetical protein [Verrucomicrobiota bacterium]